MTTPHSPGWYSDPTGAFANRYWDGQQWTNQVSSGGANAVDEPPSEIRFVPPAPGTEAILAQTPSPVQVTQQAPRSSIGTVVAVVLGIIAIIVVVFILMNQSGDDASTDPPAETPTTQAPSQDSSTDG